MRETKYAFVIAEQDYSQDIGRLTNQLWKLIPMREHEEDWESQLDTVLLELIGLGEILKEVGESFVILLSKLNGVKKEKPEFSLYRKTIFECISLLREM